MSNQGDVPALGLAGEGAGGRSGFLPLLALSFRAQAVFPGVALAYLAVLGGLALLFPRMDAASGNSVAAVLLSTVPLLLVVLTCYEFLRMAVYQRPKHPLPQLGRNVVAVLADRKVVTVGPLAEVQDFDHPWVREYFNGPRGRAARQAGNR